MSDQQLLDAMVHSIATEDLHQDSKINEAATTPICSISISVTTAVAGC